MEKRTVEVARRDKPGVKEFVPWDELTQHVADKLKQIQVHQYWHVEFLPGAQPAHPICKDQAFYGHPANITSLHKSVPV